MLINFIQLPILLVIDLFVFFFINKIFFKFNKNSIVCSICLLNRHIIIHCKHGNKDLTSFQDVGVGYSAVLESVVYYPQEKEIGLL